MTDVLKLIATFLTITILTRRKWKLGYVLIIGSAVIAILYKMPVDAVASSALHALLSKDAAKILSALIIIRIFELILRENEVFKHMMDNMRSLLRNKKGVIISMPLVIGMLPSVGGAYFSAPMVDEASKGLDMSLEDKAFTNYWYRHPWELILPVYPGILLASVITKTPLRDIIIHNLYGALLMVIVGFFFAMEGVNGGFKGESVKYNGVNRFFSFIPILSLILMVTLFNAELYLILIIETLLLFIFYRYNFKSICEAVKYGVSLELIFLIAGVMLFKEYIVSSGAVDNLTQVFHLWHIPSFPLLFLLPFICGILTGFTIGFVGGAFPLIVSLTGGDIYAISFAFVSGYAGVLLSPVHVCLVLSKEYFSAHSWGLYKRIIPSVFSLLILYAFIYLLFAKPH